VPKVTLDEFDARARGIGLCFFEVLWPVERGLTHSSGRVQDGSVRLHFTPSLSPEREAQCVRLATEVVEVAFDGQQPRCTFGNIPSEPGWHLLMSEQKFQEFAREVAPWRIEQGR
jgi:hypothetical protein